MRYVVLLAPLLAVLALACQGGDGYDRDNQALMETIPQYPSAILVARTKFTETFPVASRALVQAYATPDSPQAVLAFFREQLVDQGWQLESGDKSTVTPVYVKGSAEVIINGPSTILEPNFVGAEDVERLAETPPGTATIFSVSVNAQARSGGR